VPSPAWRDAPGDPAAAVPRARMAGRPGAHARRAALRRAQRAAGAALDIRACARRRRSWARRPGACRWGSWRLSGFGWGRWSLRRQEARGRMQEARIENRESRSKSYLSPASCLVQNAKSLSRGEDRRGNGWRNGGCEGEGVLPIMPVRERRGPGGLWGCASGSEPGPVHRPQRTRQDVRAGLRG
jgi:hypothetical protein